MINHISEGLLRSTTKVDPNAVVQDRELLQHKVEQARQDRPVENAEGGDRAETRGEDSKGTSKYTQVEDTMVFEKYDKNGDLILRIPPSEKPVNKIV
jgi:hypothetical protein